jgi:hypothetical protein
MGRFIGIFVEDRQKSNSLPSVSDAVQGDLFITRPSRSDQISERFQYQNMAELQHFLVCASEI